MVEHSGRLKWFRPSCVRPETGDQTKNRLLMAVFGEKGRDDKTRTCDLAPPRRVRYQLRYIPFLTFCGCK